MSNAIQERINLARRQAQVTAAQANCALTTLSLLDEAGTIDRVLQRRLASDAANNLRSAIRCAQAALEALDKRQAGEHTEGGE